MLRKAGLLVLTFLMFGGASGEVPDIGNRDRQQGFGVLVFSKTAGFRHESIADGIQAITALAAEHDFEATFTEDATAFTAANLTDYDAVVFLNTTGDVLNEAQQAAMEAFVQAGGGFVGVHAAADTEYGWAWYGGLVGAYFESHPPGTPTAEVRVLDEAHPSTAHLPRRWTRTDEWYNYQTNPRGDVHVLMTLDEESYDGGTMGADHPIAWCQQYDGGRSWYTGGGHTGASFSEEGFRTHLLFGIEWAAGAVEGDCGGTSWGSYEVTPLDTQVQNPMALDVANDGRVFFVERGGTAKVYDPVSGRSSVILTLSVASDFEDGLLGVALDPDFDTNDWVYLFYSPAGGVPKQHVSRFTYTGGVLDPASEEVLLEIPTQRQQCCHSGGDLDFGPDGSLYISTGDNTNPFADGYAPIDERPDRAPWDAQRTSSNTDDLRGKILRILPQPDGSYAVPEDNLFPNGTGGRAEIYAMGLRNPFRIAVDAETGWLYWGDVGPDASQPSATRGPEGLDEWNQARAAGNFGWPYCIGPNRPYRDFNYATGTSGPSFNCSAPTNDSPNNTGAIAIPAAQPSWIHYPYGVSEAFPGIPSGGGRTAIAGPLYRHDESLDEGTQLPASFDGTFFIADWTRDWLGTVTLDDAGQPLAISPFLSTETFRRPIEFEQGPDGALYLIEWGTGFGGDNPDAQLVRIAYVAGSRAPTARLTASPTAGPAPLTVTFSGAASSDPDEGEALTFSWDFENDGTPDASGAEVVHTYTDEGQYVAALTVTDPGGNEGRALVTITVGNSPPEVTILEPAEGGFFDWSDRIPFRVSVTDAEDGSTEKGSISCDDVIVQPYIGHDEHSHPLDVQNACEGVITVADGHGDDGGDLFYLVEARYADEGGGVAGSITSRDLHRLQPRTTEAEHYAFNSGTQIESTLDPLGGDQQIAFIDHGDYVAYEPVDIAGITHVTYRVASGGVGGRIELRADAADGELLSTAYVEPTGGWQTFRSVTASVKPGATSRSLYLLFLRNPGDSGLFNLNKMRFHGAGIAEPPEQPSGWRAVYLADEGGGKPVTQDEPILNYNWRTDAPVEGIDGSLFRGVWSAELTVPARGIYTLSARVDGSLRVTVDGEPVIEQAESTGVVETDDRLLRLEPDTPVEIVAEYANTSGAAQLTLLISGLGPPQPIPPAWLQPVDRTVDNERGYGDDTPVFSLEAPYPNPADTVAALNYTIPEAGDVRVTILDVLGRTVRTVLEEHQPAGPHSLRMDTGGLASGLYLFALEAGAHRATQRLLIVR